VRVRRTGAITIACAAVGWLFWLLTLLGVPPAAPGGVPAFYASLYLALSTSGALFLALAARTRAARPPARRTTTYLPHTLLESFLLLFGLWLQSLRMLTLPNTLLLLALFGVLEGGYQLASRRIWSD
jgi:hypothetical protein